MELKINCIICGKEIKKPRVGQLYCDNPACKEEFNTNMIELWKMEHPEMIQEVNKKAYQNRKNETVGLIKTKDGTKTVTIKLSEESQKELDDLEKKLNLPEIAKNIRV